MLKIRHSIPVLAAIAALAAAGCSSSSSSDSGSSSSDLAGYASPGSLVFVEGQLKPKGELKANVDSVASKIAGVDNLRDRVVSELESSAKADGESFDFASEVEPWLGAQAGIAFERLIDGELSEPLIAIESTNPKATQDFVDKRGSASSEPSKTVSYKDVDFQVGGSEDDAIGVIGESLVLANSEKEFKAAVDASDGDSLADEDRFQNAIAAASNGSFADVYVDVGGIIKQSKDQIDAQTRAVLESSGIDPNEATAVASIIPQSEQIQVDLSSELGGEKAPSGDVSDLLGSLPANSFAAVAFSDFGEQLEKAIDNIDETGLPPDLKPNELKRTVSQAGVNLDKIAASLEDGAVFAEGSNRPSLGGALVLTSKSSEAADAVASLGILLHDARVPGITAVSGGTSGFSVRSPALGPKPIVVVSKGTRIAIGYGLGPALKGLSGAGAVLSSTPSYKAAVSALGKTPISAYVDGPAALRLAEALVPRSKSDFWEARPYLKKITYIGIGSGDDDELATAKLIAGLK
jgi:Protein of unknown function (DUF3352)